MGLPVYMSQLLFAENAHLPITGDCGFIGRQTTYLTEATLNALADYYECPRPGGFHLEHDRSTLSRENFGGGFLTDRSMMSSFAIDSFKSIDVSDYEGADIILDLCQEIPPSLERSFDFIYEGSCLDNVFNPAVALSNLSRLLRPHGRMVLINHATSFNGPYTMFSPGWFFDFCAENQYADCQVFLALFSNQRQLCFGPVELFFYNWASGVHIGNTPEIPPGTHAVLLVIAQKGAESTDDRFPIQSHYREKQHHAGPFTERAMTMVRSERRLFGLPHEVWNDQRSFINLGRIGLES